MKLKESEGCNCTHPEISEGHPENCTLNQIIRCHGNQPLNELLKHIKVDNKKR